MFFHHVSIIDEETFDLIKSGIKQLKFYLNDMKRSGLKVGDFICYINSTTREEIIVSVKNIVFAKDSETLCNQLRLNPEMVGYIDKWFNKKQQKAYGLLAVGIKREK